MRLLLINSVCGTGSTGRICEQIAREYEKNGHDARIAYGRRSGDEPNEAEAKYGHRIGNDMDIRFHGIATRLYDLHGFASKHATREFLKWADDYNPDVIWLHNIHGYYINIELLFDWIKARQHHEIKRNAPAAKAKTTRVIWTLHDCWSFTGHCSHFTSVGCDRWKKGCHHCPQKHAYPGSLGFDRSKQNWLAKRHLFTGVQDMTIITPSDWLAGLVKQSFLRGYHIKTIHNGIDTTVFHSMEVPSECPGKRILLGIAPIFTEAKGLPDFITLATRLGDNYRIILIGELPKGTKLPASIIAKGKINDPVEMARYYNMADIFVNLTRDDNYPTVNLEAIACGTPVVTYDTGGSGESAKEYGAVVPQGDMEKLIEVIEENSFINMHPDFSRERMLEEFGEVLEK